LHHCEFLAHFFLNIEAEEPVAKQGKEKISFLLQRVAFKQWICCQLGAREHYAVARALQQGGRLATLYTDFWAGSVERKLGNGFGLDVAGAAASRFHPQLADAAVTSWNVRALLWEMQLRAQAKSGKRNGGSGSQYAGFIEVGRRFAIRVREALRRRPGLGQDTVIFAYDTGALETMTWCRERGIKCILNQMDPNRVEVELVREEEKRWPGWTRGTTEVPEAYFSRREQEWAMADRVVVNSAFCKQALVRQGVAAEKVFIVPLCYEADQAPTPRSELRTLNSSPSTPPLRVLFLGQVILRKGIQYLMEAARKLVNENIHFDVVGPIGISDDARASAPRNLTFHGRTSRAEATQWYARADVFVLPTLSDGFAITQLEAMAHGLQVVTTPCCGDVVSDGVDGFIVPPRNADALAKMFQRYLREPGLLRYQSQAALEKAKRYSLATLAENLARLEDALRGRI
jgi:glycosyltransferase involved in cell wall biosynthesis